MKKIGIYFSTVLIALSLCGCNQQSSPSSKIEEIPYEYTDAKRYQKLWESDVIYNETMCLIDYGNEIYGQLFYTPSQIIKIFDYTLTQELDQDLFKIDGHKLILKKRIDSIPVFDKENLLGEGNHLSEYGIGSYDGTVQGEYRKVMYAENVGIIAHHIAVTYKTSEKWGKPFNPANNYKKERISKVREKLQNKEKLNIVFFGDSIMTGCNASSRLLVEPMLPTFPDAFVNQLKKYYGYDNINLHNTSVGGTTSGWGRNMVKQYVNKYNPDLLVIGFGMNDGSNGVSDGTYISNIQTIIEDATEHTPDLEIIDVATMLPNPLSPQSYLQEEYLIGTYELLDKYDNVQIMDMTRYSKYLFEFKIACDMYANNINHPSDFMVRQYVSNLLTLLGL